MLTFWFIGDHSGLYDCKVVSWKFSKEGFTLKEMSVILFSTEHCAQLCAVHNADVGQLNIHSLCFRPAIADMPEKDTFGTEQFLDLGDVGAPLVCRKKNEAQYKFWGSYSHNIHDGCKREETDRPSLIFGVATHLQSVLYEYRFDNPFKRSQAPADNWNERF